MKLVIFSMLAVLACLPEPGSAASDRSAKDNKSAQAGRPPQIMEVDMPYELFLALGSYHDFNEDEELRNIDINQEIIPVLETIIKEFTTEKKKYEAHSPMSSAMTKRIRKIKKHVEDFKRELLYRKKVVEFRRLMKKQKTLIYR
ncbi:MAG: hypothetical protein GY862_28060 [Gammaproteobacteria bacterium]|nr:hypothetical protein [Gammaproteobacteria bacterium]